MRSLSFERRKSRRASRTMEEFGKDEAHVSRTTRTRGRIRRRTIYIASVVSILALVGGFALAAMFTTTTISQNQNGFNTQMGATKWAATTPTLGVGTSAGTCSATTANTASAPATLTAIAAPATGSVSSTAYYGVTNTCVATDFAEVITFSLTIASGTAAGTYSTDTFIVYTTWTQTSTAATAVVAGTVSVTLAAATSAAVTVTFNVVVDYGSNSPPASLTNLGVVVTGT